MYRKLLLSSQFKQFLKNLLEINYNYYLSIFRRMAGAL